MRQDLPGRSQQTLMTSSHGLSGPTFRVLQKVYFDRSLPPLQAILCFRTMSAESQLEAKKVGAVIYLATNRPLHLPDFLAEFHRSWPHLLLQKTGKEQMRPAAMKFGEKVG